MIIDMHTHIINEKVYSEYREKVGDKVSGMIVLESWEENHEELLRFIESRENLFLVKYIDIEKNLNKQILEADRLFREKKICGIKLYPGYKHYYANDKAIHKVVELCVKHNKPLMFHMGEVNDPEGNSFLKFSNPIYVDELSGLNPECKIVIAHVAYPYFIEAGMIASKNKNVYLDISGVIDNCGSRREIRRLRKQYQNDLKRVFSYYPHIKDKVMFGTDFGGNDTLLSLTKPYFKVVRNVFSRKERENVFYNTAKKLFFD